MEGEENRYGGRQHRRLADRIVPKEFFCPISKEFMSFPVRVPDSLLTYDRDSVKHLHAPENVLPDLRMRKRMNMWFSQYTPKPIFESISTRGFLVGTAISIVNKRDLSLLERFARVIQRKPWLLNDGGGMWCVATLLSCENPSIDWVLAALYILAYIDDDKKLLVPEGIDIGIHPEYSVLDPIKKALEYFESDGELLDEDFQLGFANFIHGLVMSCPDLSFMEDKMEGIAEALVEYMWPLPLDFEFPDYLRQLATLERLSYSHALSERMINSDVISMLLYVMEKGVESIEQNDDPQPEASLAVGTCMRTLQRVFHHSPQAINIFYEALMHKVFLSPHLKLVGHYVEGSDFLNELLGEPGAQFRLDIRDPSLNRSIHHSDDIDM